MDMRGKMSGRRRRLLVECEGDREHVRRVEGELRRTSAARRARLRNRRQLLAAQGIERPNHLRAV